MDKSPTNKSAAMSACAGCIVLISGIIITTLFFKSPDGVAYSPLNHFVSELGWNRCSPMARIYNASLCISCLMFMPMLWALGRQSRTALRRAAMVSGICAAFSGIMAGFLPMEIIIPHLCAALFIFLGWFFSVSLFTISFYLDKKDGMSKTVVAAGAVAATLCLLLLILPKSEGISFIKSPDSFARPRFWLLPFTEWGFFVSLFLWGLAVAAKLWSSSSVVGHADTESL